MTDSTGPGDEKTVVDPPQEAATGRGPEPPGGQDKTVLDDPSPANRDWSVLLQLDTSVKIGTGVSLRQLDDDQSLPEVHKGRERYQMLKTLGEGGMGEVHLVADRDLKRRVAMKVIRPDAVAHTRRFLEEIQILAQLDHPNIVPLFDLSLAADKRPYCTMRYVRGHTLGDVIEGLEKKDPEITRSYSLTRLMQVYQQIVQAMGYAHAKGVVHRDLKPVNVMLGEHGEVQVLDWGLAKVLGRSQVETESLRSPTQVGQVMGTWSYMSPEQGMGQEVDERADIWSLGVMLYELLTLERPFGGKTQWEMMAALFAQEPESPRARAPERNIPLELEALCLRCLRKNPTERPQDAVEILAGLQEWLEASADKEKRHELAEAKAAEGRALLAEYFQGKEEVKRLRAEAEAIGKRFEGWQPMEEKLELIAAEDAHRDQRRRLARLATSVVGTLSEALAFEQDCRGARELLADYYRDRFLDAAARFDDDDLDYFGGLVARYHDGKYERELGGVGSLALTSDPPSCEVWIHTLVENGFVLTEGDGRHLGTTPLAATPLAMGSYVVVLRKEGYRDVRYPVHITRNREWSGGVRLYPEDEIGKDLVYIPAGCFVMGGDSEAANSLPRAEVEVEDFAIGKFPVTMGEYLEYVNFVARSEGLEAAKLRSPRRTFNVASSSYLLEARTGGLKLPELDAEGDRWDAQLPANGITWHDAVAYCAWRSVRDRREYRLPSEEEWEKAARGVDGRWYPWGNRFDPSLCNMNLSRRRPAPATIAEFPRDVSVYGAFGLAGNVMDWTSTELVSGTEDSRRAGRVFRGGSWGSVMRNCRAARRDWHGPSRVYGYLGFRIARSLR